MSAPNLGFATTLYLALAIAAGEQARGTLLNHATEHDLAELRQLVLNTATNDERRTADFARNRGSDLDLICAIALRKNPVVTLDNRLVVRLLNFLKRLNTFSGLDDVSETLGTLIAQLESAANLLPLKIATEPTINDRLREFYSRAKAGPLLSGDIQQLGSIIADVDAVAKTLSDGTADICQALQSGIFDNADLDNAEDAITRAAAQLAATAGASLDAAAQSRIVYNGFAYRLANDEPHGLVCTEIREDGSIAWSESVAVDFDRCDDDERPKLIRIRETLQTLDPS